MALPELDNREKDKLSTLLTEIEKDLTGNILPFWTEKSIDPDGGFYGEVLNDGRPVPETPKGSILNFRILWTFSEAYRISGNPVYKELSDRAAEYCTDHFIDPQFGGIIWTVTPRGEILDGIKQSYATAFGIYGLAAHYRATGYKNSLEQAINLYHTLEDKVHDDSGLGYFEVFERDYSPSPHNGVDNIDGATKTMNTHIHVMEAYTMLFRVWHDNGLKARIEELLDIIQGKLYSRERHHLIRYTDNDWNPIGFADTYGHDIETSWLMTEAAVTIGNPKYIESTRKQAVMMTQTALTEGMSPDGYMRDELTDKGYSKLLSWWTQCETIVGCINTWQITGESKYIDAAAGIWNYIKEHFIDRKDGEWFKILLESGEPAPGFSKISMWNCPYHNCRMGFELKERLN